MCVVDCLFLAVIRLILRGTKVLVNSCRPQLEGKQIDHKGITLLSNQLVTQALAIHKIIEVATRIDLRVGVPISQALIVPSFNICCRVSQRLSKLSLDHLPIIFVSCAQCPVSRLNGNTHVEQTKEVTRAVGYLISPALVVAMLCVRIIKDREHVTAKHARITIDS